MSKRIYLDPIVEEPSQDSHAHPTFLDHLIRSRYIIQLGLLIVVSAGVLFVGHTWYQRRQEIAIQRLMWRANRYYEAGDYDKALQGDGLSQGFISIAQAHPQTKAGQLAHYYVGLIYCKQEKYQEAIQALKQYNLKDPVIQVRTWGLLGDLYVDLDNYQEALIYYQKAIEHMPNRFTTPNYLIKVAKVYEAQRDYAQASACYEKIIVDFPTCEQYTSALTHRARVEELVAHMDAATPADSPTA